jgi:hypothetical protein
MSGETDLGRLIREMKPELHEGEYVFCTVSEVRLSVDIEPLCLFQEQEGTTVILPKQRAEQLELPYSFVSAWITLTIHSAHEAIGFIAAISQELAKAGISCNVISAYYHDHLFVPIEEAQRTMTVLNMMSKV